MKKMILLLISVSSFAFCAPTAVLDHLTYVIRDPETNRASFRAALEKIGEYLALDVLEELETHEQTVRTLTNADATHHLLAENPVLVTIMRAGLPLNQGVQRIFPHSEVGFFVMARNEKTLKASVDYVALPEIKNQSVILADTMLATAGSVLNALDILQKYHPKQIYIIAAIVAQPGIDRVLEKYPDVKIFAGAVDPYLNEVGYIIPGLGDAGDRSYGEKVHTLDCLDIKQK